MYFSVLYCYGTGPIVLIKIGLVPYNQGPVPYNQDRSPGVVFIYQNRILAMILKRIFLARLVDGSWTWWLEYLYYRGDFINPKTF